MKPWEETWSLTVERVSRDLDGCVDDACSRHGDGWSSACLEHTTGGDTDSRFQFFHVPNEDLPALVLAAAAPDMARALLAMGAVCGLDGWHTLECSDESDGCLDVCSAARAAFMRAGVLTE